jgi:hypothetical protein
MSVSGIRYIRDTISGGSNVNGSAHWVEIQALNASATNVAVGKTVTANKTPSAGSLSYVTDGDASSTAPVVDMGAGLVQVTVDLGAVTDIATIKVFHYFGDGRYYAGMVTEVSVDGSTWVQIYSFSQNGGYPETASGHSLNAPFGSLAPVGGGSTTAATVNETGAPSTQGNTSSTGAATVTPAGAPGTATIKTKPLAPFGGSAQISIIVPNVVIMKLDRTVVLSLANLGTDSTGCLSVNDAALVAGTTYIVAYFNVDGSLRGIAKVTAV